MRWIILMMLLPAVLFAADPAPVVVNQGIGDSIAVAVLRVDSTILLAGSGDYNLIPLENGKVDVECGPLVRDSLGRCVRLCKKIRMRGVDSSAVRVLVTVTDTLPLEWNGKAWRLDADGVFQQRE